MMTLLEVFEKVRFHLLTQKSKSHVAPGLCVYRGSNGSKCAVGCLIKDEFYNPSFEGKACNHVTIVNALVASEVESYDKQMLRMLLNLQDIHDNFDPEHWERLLTDFYNAFFSSGEFDQQAWQRQSNYL